MKFTKFLKKLTLLAPTLIFIHLYGPAIPSGAGLTIVESTDISIPGNYRVGNDFSGRVRILASNVHVDLDGHTISNGNPNCIEVTNQNDIFIKNGRIINTSPNGIFIDTCENISIENIDFLQNSNGLTVFTTTALNIQNCTFLNQTTNGVNFSNVSNSKINNTKMHNSAGSSLLCKTSKNILLKNLHANDNFNGLVFSSSNGITIIDSQCKNNVNGIIFQDSNNNLIQNCIVSNSQNTGIIVIDDTLVIDTISNQNDIGIELQGNNNCIKNNVINYNTTGILNSGSNNSFFDNKAQLNTTNYDGLPSSNISIFNLPFQFFVSTPSICCSVNISALDP